MGLVPATEPTSTPLLLLQVSLETLLLSLLLLNFREPEAWGVGWGELS